MGLPFYFRFCQCLIRCAIGSGRSSGSRNGSSNGSSSCRAEQVDAAPLHRPPMRTHFFPPLQIQQRERKDPHLQHAQVSVRNSHRDLHVLQLVRVPAAMRQLRSFTPPAYRLPHWPLTAHCSPLTASPPQGLPGLGREHEQNHPHLRLRRGVHVHVFLGPVL